MTGRRRLKPFAAWQIEITTRCPLACRMCIRQGLPGWTSSDMSLADFRGLVPYFDDVRSVVLQGWGEPLLHKDLISIVRAAKLGPEGSAGYRAPEVGFVTSGIGLDRHLSSELIRAGLDFIGFSLAGGVAETHEVIRVKSGFEDLINAVRTFHEIRASHGTTLPRSHVVYLMLRDNMRDLPLLPRLARDTGVTTIVLSNLIHVTTAWHDRQRVYAYEGHSEYEDILKETMARAKEFTVEVRVPGLVARDVAVCEENPLGNLYISVDGEVSPCVYLCPPVSSPFKRIFCGREGMQDKVVFGNVFREPFGRVWDAAAYTEFRQKVSRRLHRSRPGPSLIAAISGTHRNAGGDILPAAPEPCRTCHKMLGL